MWTSSQTTVRCPNIIQAFEIAAARRLRPKRSSEVFRSPLFVFQRAFVDWPSRAVGYFGPGNEVWFLLSGYARNQKTYEWASNAFWIACRNKRGGPGGGPLMAYDPDETGSARHHTCIHRSPRNARIGPGFEAASNEQREHLSIRYSRSGPYLAFSLGVQMKLRRRKFLQLGGAAVGAPALLKIANAQTYPSRPITMIVAFAPGGSTDVIGRMLAERMGRSLGQTIIIENVSGANGSIGTGRAARARPDGYTISLGPMDTYVLNGAFYSLQYDVLNDFTPITPVAAFPLFLYARNTMPARDLPELIAWLKGNSKATLGFGIVSLRLLAAFFQRETKTQFALVPYRGTAPTMEDLIAGHIDLSFNTPDQLSLLRAGSIRAYAVTGETRMR
jgi:hypothetical protein